MLQPKIIFLQQNLGNLTIFWDMLLILTDFIKKLQRNVFSPFTYALYQSLSFH